jgi:hypothetical protein
MTEENNTPKELLSPIYNNNSNNKAGEWTSTRSATINLGFRR